MSLWVIVYAIGAVQALMLALALWRRSVNPQANRLLAAWLGIVGVDLAVKALYLAQPSPGLLAAYQFVRLFPFLYGSLFYLYVRALISGHGFALRDLVHLGGYLLVTALTLPLLLGGSGWTVELAPGWSAQRWPPAWFNPFLYAYSLSYVFAALVCVHRYRRRLRQRRSDADRLSLRWIDALAAGQIVIWSIACLAQLAHRITGYYLIYAAVAAWVCVVGWFSLGQPPVAELPEGPESEPEQGGGDGRDDDARFPEVEARLAHLMDRDALYREPALSIGQVAKRSGYPEYLVSAVINRRLGGNFWEYINRYRVEAARACLANPVDTRTILDIAYDCGFTSKSTFNAAFKRQVGQTPSGYRRSGVSRPAASSAGGREQSGR